METPVAVLVNLRARRGSDAVVRACRRALPGASILASRSTEDAKAFTRALDEAPPELVVAAGGDGTAVGLINALRGGPASEATIACLRLGTGNGWARDTGAPALRPALRQLREHYDHGSSRTRGLPRKRFDLVEVEGTLAHYAGTGWDAEIIDDFHAQQSGFGVLPRRARNGLAGYLHALTTRTVPAYLLGLREAVEVELTNTGEDAIEVDAEGRPVYGRGAAHGEVLYRGPISVCAAGTTQQWGFEFKAFPFAGLVPRRFCMRAYTGSVIEAVRSSRDLWLGRHPIPNNHVWMLSGCRAEFSRPIPFQIGGDRVGYRQTIEYRLAPEQVDLLAWDRMSTGAHT